MVCKGYGFNSWEGMYLSKKLFSIKINPKCIFLYDITQKMDQFYPWIILGLRYFGIILKLDFFNSWPA